MLTSHWHWSWAFSWSNTLFLCVSDKSVLTEASFHAYHNAEHVSHIVFASRWASGTAMGVNFEFSSAFGLARFVDHGQHFGFFLRARCSRVLLVLTLRRTIITVRVNNTFFELSNTVFFIDSFNISQMFDALIISFIMYFFVDFTSVR